LEKELKEKQKTTSATLATIEKLKKDAAIADNTTTTNNAVVDNTTKTTDNTTADNTTTSSAVNTNKKYAEDVAATSGIANESEREKAKADVLMDWSKAIDEYVANKKIEMQASDDSEMKALLAMKIKQGEDL